MQEGYLETTMHRPAGQEPASECKQKRPRNAFFDRPRVCNAMNEFIVILVEDIQNGCVVKRKKLCELRMKESLLSSQNGPVNELAKEGTETELER